MTFWEFLDDGANWFCLLILCATIGLFAHACIRDARRIKCSDF